MHFLFTHDSGSRETLLGLNAPHASLEVAPGKSGSLAEQRQKQESLGCRFPGFAPHIAT